jgi:DNA-binding transcriptional LysR family regulator
MSDRIFALRLFVRVARTGSFSRAGREFGLSQPSASRIVAELEREIGTTLFTRTTRAVTLTEAGTDYLLRIEPMLASLDEADHAVRGTGELRGILRVALSSSFSVREIIPRLPEFMERHPNLKIDLLVDDRYQELVSEGVDVALRFGTLANSTAMARRLGDTARLLVASPSYLQRAGIPKSPQDLADHSLIVGPTGVKPGNWTFKRNGHTKTLRVEGRLNITTNEGAIAAAIAGLGIVSTAVWGCRIELTNGTLVQVLDEWSMESVEVNALFPAGRAAKPAARAFADYLTKALAK